MMLTDSSGAVHVPVGWVGVERTFPVCAAAAATRCGWATATGRIFTAASEARPKKVSPIIAIVYAAILKHCQTVFEFIMRATSRLRISGEPMPTPPRTESAFSLLPNSQCSLAGGRCPPGTGRRKPVRGVARYPSERTSRALPSVLHVSEDVGCAHEGARVAALVRSDGCGPAVDGDGPAEMRRCTRVGGA